MPPDSMATSVPVPMAMPTCGLRERRRVVDAIAGHGDHRTLLLQAFDCFGFPRGQDVGFEGDSQLLCQGLGSGPVITRHHHHVDAFLLQRFDRRHRRFSNRVGNGNQTRHAAIHGHEHHRLAVLSFCLGL